MSLWQSSLCHAHWSQKHESCRNQLETDMINSRVYERRNLFYITEWRNWFLTTLVLLQFLSLSLFSFFASSISVFFFGQIFTFHCHLQVVTEENCASSCCGHVMADKLLCATFQPSNLSSCHTGYHSDSVVYSQPTFTWMVSSFLQPYHCDITVTSLWYQDLLQSGPLKLNRCQLWFVLQTMPLACFSPESRAVIMWWI